jgi:cofilin
LFSAAECVSEFDRLRSGLKATRPKFTIYKVSDDNQSLEVEETSLENDYDAFRLKLSNAADKDGNPAPRYALYHMKHDLGIDGKQ